MIHDTPLIATLVFGLGIAFIFGVIANRLRIPPLVGYLVAGVMIGPFTPGYVADQTLAPQLAEIGVILLMFGVGLHFSLKDLLSVKAIAVPGALVQIAFATLLGLGLAVMMGWSVAAGLVFGLALSVASTVVLLRALQERRLVDSEKGKIAVGWLIVEDLAMVLALVLLPALATLVNGPDAVANATHSTSHTQGIAVLIGITLLKVAAFVVFMLVVGRRIIPWVLHYVAHTGSRELFRLAVLAIALGVAFAASHLFGVSLALGAFFAGMILSESQLSQRAAEETLPLRDAFAVLFFVSVGMLFDPSSLINDPLPLLATLFIILIGKSVAAYVIVIAFKYPVPTALTISASLAQIGEFSFILSELGVKLNLLPEKGRDLILAGAILSILVNPLVFWGIKRLRPYLDRTSPAAQPAAATDHSVPAETAALVTQPVIPDEVLLSTALTHHTVLVGYGRAGRIIGKKLSSLGLPFLVIDDASKTAEELRLKGIECITGNAATSDVLRAANVAGARRLVLAVPNAFEAGQMVQQARARNPGLDIMARVETDAEAAHLKSFGANTVFMTENEVARAMLEHVLEDILHSMSGPGAPEAQEPQSQEH
jgi:CPA2 family monovalent cation:H+ antiporter-2